MRNAQRITHWAAIVGCLGAGALYCGVLFYTPWLVAVGIPAAVIGVGVALWGAGHKTERGAVVDTVYGVQAEFYDGGWWTRVFQTHPVGPKAGSRIIDLEDARAAAETMNAHRGTYRDAIPVRRTATPWEPLDSVGTGRPVG